MSTKNLGGHYLLGLNGQFTDDFAGRLQLNSLHFHVAMDILEKIRRDRERRRERDQKIVAAREAGQTYAAIGRQFTLSGENVKARIDRYFREKRKEEGDDPFVKLSSRTLKILQREGLMTIDKVLEVHRHNKLLCIRGFGRKSLREVEKWFHVARATPARTRDCIVQTKPLAD